MIMLKHLSIDILKLKNAFTNDTIIQSCAYTHTQALRNVCMVVFCLDSSRYHCSQEIEQPFHKGNTAGLMGHTLGALQHGMGTFNVLFRFTTPHTCKRTLLFLKNNRRK